MTDNKVTVTAAPVPTDEIGQAVHHERIRIIDAVLKVAHESGWCNEVLDALDVAFINRDVQWNDGVYRSSEGFDVWGYGTDGYNKDGYNEFGYDRDGYNERGYDRNGYNKYGYKDRSYEPCDCPACRG